MKTNPTQTLQPISNANELTDDELDQVIGGAGLLSSPLALKATRDTAQGWVREVVEDVEAY